MGLWPDIADDTREGIEATQEMSGQQDDILCLCLAPPHSVASGAYDGTIVIHNILSGITKHTFRIAGLERLPVNERAIEGLVFLQKKATVPLFSYSADGRLRLWNVSRANPQVVVDIGIKLSEHKNGSKPADVSSIAVDRENTLLLCGDAAGWVAIRDISRLDATQPSTASTISLVNKWCAHGDAITGVDFAANKGMLITASVDTSLRLWQMNGTLVGVFGSTPWNLKELKDSTEAAEAEAEEDQSTFFMTTADASSNSKPSKPSKPSKVESSKEAQSNSQADKLPQIRQASREREDRVDRADKTVAAFCAHRDRQRDGPMYKPRILAENKCEDIPYLQRHMKVGVPFSASNPSRRTSR